VRLLAILALLVAPQAAASLAILPVADGRIIWVARPFQPAEVRTPAPPFSDFVASLALVTTNANQDSRVGTLSLSGSGETFVDGAGDTDNGSLYDLTFRVDQPATFTVTAVVGGSMEYITVRLGDSSHDLFDFELSGFGQTQLEESGVLAPGTDYRLVIGGAPPPTGYQVGTYWEFEFAVAVPEPTSALLALLCLFACRVSGWQRRAG